MLGAINFNPVQAVNSLLNPLGLTLSTKQQIISKIAFASLAMLAINNALQKVDGTCTTHCEDRRECIPTRVRVCYYNSPCPEI
ncbi:MAG: hypothetical protein ACRCU0_01960 [Candidatus Rhabdochlamydia sp.]